MDEVRNAIHPRRCDKLPSCDVPTAKSAATTVIDLLPIPVPVKTGIKFCMAVNCRQLLISTVAVMSDIAIKEIKNCKKLASPDINPKDVAGKTPDEIEKVAEENGLIPKGDPKSGNGAYIDPVTGKQRILIHPKPSRGSPHCHVNNPEGERLDINGDVVPPESAGAHLDLNYP